MKPQIYNIVVAAGKGSRFGSDLPKQFCRIDNTPVLAITLGRLDRIFTDGPLASEYDAETILVLSEHHLELWHDICSEFSIPPHTVVIGGASRWESVKNAVDYIKSNHHGDFNSAIITVHDGARPLIDVKLFRNVIDGIGDGDGCIPAVAVVDSLRQLDAAAGISHPLDRASIRAVQTPQAFPADRLVKAYLLPYKPTFTDDASVMAEAGYTDIRMSEGNPHNIKITLPSDLKIASIYLQDEPAP